MEELLNMNIVRLTAGLLLLGIAVVAELADSVMILKKINLLLRISRLVLITLGVLYIIYTYILIH